ncbi:hypothetical protein BELL_0891g00030 [Botrytis elliptica]|uniref:Uncharacterized protein n=1 Tax=Botrytis elliptica TaxID=278938 RepID=A0A4Z1JEQ7_9HELO|nr:hypothetical protein BELL_0891g00030 [Botrytis elliptica]
MSPKTRKFSQTSFVNDSDAPGPSRNLFFWDSIINSPNSPGPSNSATNPDYSPINVDVPRSPLDSIHKLQNKPNPAVSNGSTGSPDISSTHLLENLRPVLGLLDQARSHESTVVIKDKPAFSSHVSSDPPGNCQIVSPESNVQHNDKSPSRLPLPPVSSSIVPQSIPGMQPLDLDVDSRASQ